MHETAFTSVFFTPFVTLAQILAFILLHFHLFLHAQITDFIPIPLCVSFFFPPLFLEQELNFYEKLSCAALIMKKNLSRFSYFPCEVKCAILPTYIAEIRNPLLTYIFSSLKAAALRQTNIYLLFYPKGGQWWMLRESILEK